MDDAWWAHAAAHVAPRPELVVGSLPGTHTTASPGGRGSVPVDDRSAPGSGGAVDHLHGRLRGVLERVVLELVVLELVVLG